MAVEIDVLHELNQVEVRIEIRQADQRRIPRRIDIAELIGQVQRIEAVVIALRDIAKRVTGTGTTGPNDVQLIVEHEKIRRRAVRRVRFFDENLGGMNIEEAPEYIVHRDERRGHAAARPKELPATHAEFF